MAKNLLENCNGLNSIFIGRDEQKNNFTNLLKQNNKKRVYNIHGVGGVGKTKLLGEFREQIKNIQNNPTIYAYINLEQENLTPIESLVKLAIAFRSNYSKFTLPTFWVAYTIYFSKANPQLTLKNINESLFFNELQAITDLSSIVDGGIPNLLTKLYSYIDSKVESGDIKDIRDELETFKNLEDKEQIISYLAYFLANDIDNYKKAYNYKQVIILLDAYENIWQNSQNTIDCTKDSFIRYLLIQLESNYLCVISGKEKIIWQSNNCNYLPEVEYKYEPLNGFIEKEAFEYLQKANIKEQEIIEQITNNAQGLPLYLYLEALTYSHFEKPSIEVFKNSTKEEVLNRFLKHLNQDEKAALEYFAHANSLTKELAIAISKEFNLNLNTIEKVLNYSFFNKDNNIYKLHSLLKKHIIANNTQIFKKQIEKFLLNYYESTFKNLELKDFKNLNIEEIEHNLKEAFYYKEQLVNIEELAKWINGYYGLFYEAGQFNTLEFIYSRLANLLKTNANTTEVLGGIYNNLALLYRKKGEYKNAERYYIKSIKICEEILGIKDIDTATAYDNLAGLYELLGEYKHAKEYYLKSLKIREEELGLNHSDTAIIYNNIAGFYISQEEYKKAEEYYLRALKIREQELAFNPIHVASIYNNLALLYSMKGEYKTAEKFYLKTLKIRQDILGVKHEDISLTYNNLASLYYRQEKYQKAEEYYLKSLKIIENISGLNHINIASIYNNIAFLYLNIDKLKEAKEYFEKALKIFKNKLPNEHQNIRIAEEGLKIVNSKL